MIILKRLSVATIPNIRIALPCDINKRLFLVFGILLVLVFSTKCTGPSYELSGVVHDGLDGEAITGVEVLLEGTTFSTVTDERGIFSLKLPYSVTSGVLIAGKAGYQLERYQVSFRTTGLTITILPEPKIYKASDYAGAYIPFTSRLEHAVQWEHIIDGVRLFYEKRIDAMKPERKRYWNRDFSSQEAYIASVARNRAHFRTMLGAVDERDSVSMEKLTQIGETDTYIVYEVRWSVLKEVVQRPALQNWPTLDVPGQIFGEGLLLEPKGLSRGYAIAIPDADQNPEDLVGMGCGIDENSQFARRLAENDFTVVVPVIIDRSNRWSRGTNRPSRTWIYAQAQEMGRTVAGYEIQKMEAVIDWFAEQGGSDSNIGIAGYGEGGLIAFYTAALDTRVKATLVSGYFAPREKIWQEPIYRNIWSLLREFGDAELASLIAPRSLVVEYSDVPEYKGSTTDGKEIEPPGELWTHSFVEVESEFDRITSLTAPDFGERVLVRQDSGNTISFGSEKAMIKLMNMLGHSQPISLSDVAPEDIRNAYDATERMGRMVEQMVGHTQLLLRDSEYVRKDFIDTCTNQQALRNYFNQELIGWLNDDFLPINARTKLFDDQPGYTCYDVLMDVLPDVEFWGILCVPKGIKEGEKRAVVVLQHGRGGNPATALSEGSYFEAGRRLADRGFVVFTPFGNWTGETRFRWIDRIAKPTKAGIWSTVAREHQQLIRWLKTLPFVDTSRIALYGKSIGGQAAVLVASMIPEYALSISCAYFNEGSRKETSVYFPTSFVYHVDSEMPMWNRGHTIEYAEMANSLIFPRPFMVEHGRLDGIAPPEWVEHEYAKVSDYYERMGMGDLTEIDLHEGGHIINGVKSYPFLHRHLDWPEP